MIAEMTKGTRELFIWIDIDKSLIKYYEYEFHKS